MYHVLTYRYFANEAAIHTSTGMSTVESCEVIASHVLLQPVTAAFGSKSSGVEAVGAWVRAVSQPFYNPSNNEHISAAFVG